MDNQGFDEESLRIIAKLRIHIGTLETKEPQMYFSGESDSNQCKFETMSNNLLVGVICSDRKLALVLLLLVRCIYGNDLKDFSIYMDECDGSSPIQDIFEHLSKQENEVYLSTHPIQSEYTGYLWEFRGGKPNKIQIKRRIDEIDIWTISRIFKHFDDDYGLDNF